MGRLAKTDPERHCQQCHRKLTRKRMNGRLEDYGVFLRRKYCDQTCMGLAQTMEHPTSWSTYHWRAPKHRKNACEACGETRRLVVHHVDQDRRNNAPENLQTLCAWCHDFWHSAADRVGRKVAGRMPCLLASDDSLSGTLTA